MYIILIVEYIFILSRERDLFFLFVYPGWLFEKLLPQELDVNMSDLKETVTTFWVLLKVVRLENE
jgi:hypothetical protein